jgi:dynein assembly factor 1
MEMNVKEIKKICKELKLYNTPEVNDVLYLHFKGFTCIQNLEEYVNVKVIYLEGNGFKKIGGGLASLTKLKCLYLQENVIDCIEGLDTLEALDTLNLSQNFLDKVGGLDKLTKLNTLLLPSNRIGCNGAGDFEHIKQVPSLSVLDLSNNKIKADDAEAIVDVVTSLPNLKVLYLKGNPCVRNIDNYRRTLIAG